MMIMRACSVLVLLAFSLISCISTSASMESWVGADEATLIARWGKPGNVISNAPDGKIFIYVRMDSYSSHGGGDSNIYGSGSTGSDIPGQEMRWERKYIFWLDNEGIVHNVDMQKEEVPFIGWGETRSPFSS